MRSATTSLLRNLSHRIICSCSLADLDGHLQVSSSFSDRATLRPFSSRSPFGLFSSLSTFMEVRAADPSPRAVPDRSSVVLRLVRSSLVSTARYHAASCTRGRSRLVRRQLTLHVFFHISGCHRGQRCGSLHRSHGCHVIQRTGTARAVLHLGFPGVMRRR